MLTLQFDVFFQFCWAALKSFACSSDFLFARGGKVVQMIWGGGLVITHLLTRQSIIMFLVSYWVEPSTLLLLWQISHLYMHFVYNGAPF